MNSGIGSMGVPGAGAPMKFLSAWNTMSYVLHSEVYIID